MGDAISLLTGRDTLDTPTTSQTADSRFGNALDIISKNLTMALGATLAKTLSTLTA